MGRGAACRTGTGFRHPAWHGTTMRCPGSNRQIEQQAVTYAFVLFGSGAKKLGPHPLFHYILNAHLYGAEKGQLCRCGLILRGLDESGANVAQPAKRSLPEQSHTGCGAACRTGSGIRHPHGMAQRCDARDPTGRCEQQAVTYAYSFFGTHLVQQSLGLTLAAPGALSILDFALLTTVLAAPGALSMAP